MGVSSPTKKTRPHAAHVAVLSYGFWQHRFGGDPRIVGNAITLGGEPYVVVGVTAPRFSLSLQGQLDAQPDVWVPFQFNPASTDMAHYFLVTGRLRPGVTLQQANAELKLISDRFREKFPKNHGPNDGFVAVSMQEAMVSDVRSSLIVLVIAVAFVLLIACANVANLLLVRATGRKRELAIRAAMGASRARLTRQMLTEAIVLSLSGGLLGLGAGAFGVRALLAVSPGNIPRLGEGGSAAIAMDWRVFAFTFVIAIITGILFGMAPALIASRADIGGTLKESGGRSGSGLRQNRTRSLLVVSEMALALVLLIGAGLLIRTLVALRSVDAGFDAHNVLTLRMSYDDPRFQTTANLAGMVRSGLDRLSAVPGVEAAAATCSIPLEGGFALPFIIAGRPLNGPAHGGATWANVSPAFFDVFRIPVVRGRAFTDQDSAAAPPVVIINQAMAKKYWPSADPINQQLIIGKDIGFAFDDPPRRIVGVVGSVRDGDLHAQPDPEMYIPQAQVPDPLTALNARVGTLGWVLRSRVEPHTLISQAEDALRQATGGLPVANVRTMDEIVIHSTARESFNMLLLSIFAGSALLLAAIGIYGVMAYSVQQRSRELGIRMALGASAGRIRNMVVGQGGKLALGGVAIGLVAALALTRLMKTFLFGVKAWDPVAFLAVPFLLILVALLAVWLPARRATRVNPVDSLRYE